MSKTLDQVVVIDLESTCWDREDPLSKQHGEIIEIGVALLELATLEVHSSASYFVRPVKTQIGAFCTGLTSIKPEDVAQAPVLFDACAELRKYNVKDRTWASWGDYDRRQFERQCALDKITYPFGPTHLNVKNLYALLTGRREVGMAEALERLQLPLEGHHHRGVDDAKNIAKILAKLIGLTRRAPELK